MNGDRMRFTAERMKEILKAEFLIPEDMLDKMGIEQAAAANGERKSRLEC